MKARLYTILFALLPYRQQRKLWNRLANKLGYEGIIFGKRIYFIGSPVETSAWYEQYADIMDLKIKQDDTKAT